MFKIGSMVVVFVSEQVSFVAKIVKMNYKTQKMTVMQNDNVTYNVSFDYVDPV